MEGSGGPLSRIRFNLEGVAAKDVLMSLDGRSCKVAGDQITRWKSNDLPFLDTQRIKFGSNTTNVLKSIPQLKALLSKVNDRGKRARFFSCFLFIILWGNTNNKLLLSCSTGRAEAYFHAHERWFIARFEN